MLRGALPWVALLRLLLLFLGVVRLPPCCGESSSLEKWQANNRCTSTAKRQAATPSNTHHAQPPPNHHPSAGARTGCACARAATPAAHSKATPSKRTTQHQTCDPRDRRISGPTFFGGSIRAQGLVLRSMLTGEGCTFKPGARRSVCDMRCRGGASKVASGRACGRPSPFWSVAACVTG